jgi:hypothetical protein
MINGINVKTLEDGRHEVSGKTFHFKDEIKELGGKWDNARKIWTLPKDTDLEFLVVKKVIPKEVRPKVIPAYGCCCEKAKLMEEYWQGPMYYQCEDHGMRPTTKKGFGYTGD